MSTTPSVPEDDGKLPSVQLPKSSVWDKAKKVAQLGSASAAKTAELGKQTISAASDVTQRTLESGKQVYTGSKLESAVKYLDGELEQRGAKKAISETKGAVFGKLDQVTGKRLIELLEEKLRIQDEYNDILATRLAEALERIARLETRSNEH